LRGKTVCNIFSRIALAPAPPLKSPPSAFLPM
jgi:hypothetical protein